MVVTDGITKYVALIAIPDKQVEAMAMALFMKWLCRHRFPNKIVSADGEKEFCNKVVKKNAQNDESKENCNITISSTEQCPIKQ